MTKLKFKVVLPYIGIPIFGAALLIINPNRIDAFTLLQYEVLIIFGYIAAVSDLKSKRIPNALTFAMLAAWILTVIPKLFFDTDETINILKSAAIGFIVSGGVFLFVYIISRKGLGGGDVKFMAAAGLYLGLSKVLSAMLYGTMLAGIIGLLLLILKKIGRKDTIPLAPFLYIGILITVFF